MADLEKKRVTVDGHTYELQPWAVDDGRRWLHRITKAVAVGVSKGETDVEVAASIVAELEESKFLDFCRTVVKYTSLVGEGKDSRETIVALSTIEGEHFRGGKHFLLLALAKEHVLQEFGDFFARGRQLLPGSGAEGK